MRPVDERAKQILIATVDASMRWEPLPPRGDLAYAKAKRMLFAPLTATHDDVLARTRQALAKLSLGHVTAAFLASLTSGRRDLRSGLGSYTSKRVRTHEAAPFVSSSAGTKTCSVCWVHMRYRKYDLDFISYQRHVASPMYSDPIYKMLDLEELAREPRLAPTKEDVAMMKDILRAVSTSPASETPAKLSMRLKPIVGWDRHARDNLIDALAICGVLVPSRERSSERFHYAEGWRGSDGFDAKRVKALFGKHGVT